jgi:hypothetical protein
MDHQAIEPRHGSFLAWRRRHALQPGTPCRNCETTLLGPWCFACGQAAHDTHRSAWHLAAETFENFFHADGRLWRTLARLIYNPARLTQDYLAGKRAPQIPPLRLFLVVLLILALIGDWVVPHVPVLQLGAAADKDRAALMQTEVHLGLSPDMDKAATDWLRLHVGRAMDHPVALATAMRERAHDFAFLMLPISALILAAIFAFRRGVVLFDHFIFSMHSLSFVGLLICTAIVGSLALQASCGWMVWAAPVHLFAHMRGVYRTGIFGTLVRMFVLFVCSMVAFVLLTLALVFAGLQMLPG